MSGLKRPYPHDEGGSSALAPYLIEKRRFFSISEAGVPATSLCTTESIDRHNNNTTYCDDKFGEYALSPASSISPPSSGDSLEVPSSTESTWTPLTASSNTEVVEICDEGDELEICFGMLVDGLLSAWKPSTISKILSSRPTLKPRFRDNGITILSPEIQEMGVLDNETASGMISLKNAVPSVRFDIYACQGMKQVQSQDGKQGISLEILIFGLKSSLDQVGSLLSQSSLFLQEPINRQLSVPYKNPHVFAWDEEDERDSTYLLEPSSENQIDFTEKIQAVLNETNVPRLSFQVEQDARITSTLKQHQLIALKFMLTREGLVETDRLTLWRPVTRNGRQVFKNEITHSTKISEPMECRGGILADEMGMGKSLSLLSLIIYTLHRQRSDTEENRYLSYQKDEVCSSATLIIAPKSTIQGWEQQVHEHMRPGALKLHVYHGNGRKICREKLRQFDIVLTTYETATSDSLTSGMLSGISWLRIVLDEAHQIRNRSTRIFQELTKLRAERRWCLTGTPVQNRLSDLFSLTQFLRFKPLETHANARKYILEPLSRKDSMGLENLRLALQTISLRRTRQSCSTRRKTETVELVILNERERGCYTTTRADARKALSSAAGKSQGQILLRAINTLRQICSHGGAIIDDVPDIQHTREHNACDKCGDPIDSQNDSQQAFHGTCGHNVCSECTVDQNGHENTALNNRSESCSVCQEPAIAILDSGQQSSGEQVNNTMMDLDTETALASAVRSSKIEKVIMHLQNLQQTSPAHRVDPIKSLVFSHWNRTLDCIEEALSCHGKLYVRVDGSLSVEQRRTAIHQFNTVPEIRVLLLSYGTGSVGLNLQAATHVHLLEPHWNPMVEAQAAARVDRLDQLKDVYIHRYIVKDSIEEHIQNKQRSKLQDVELSVSSMATGEGSNIGANNSMELRDLL